MGDRYILDGHTPKKADLMTWAKFIENGEARRVANTVIGRARVSTVFLGIDHRFGEGSPLLFETMVFGGDFDEDMDRCSTWDQAEAMHKAMCEKVTKQEEQQ